MLRELIVTVCECALFVAVIGCSSDPDKATVSGRVTLDGAPVKSGIIQFVPADGQTATADAPITDGEYSATVPPGEKQVSISAPKIVGKTKMIDEPDGPSVDLVEELLPARYNVKTELTYSATAGKQMKNFELTSK